MKSQLRNAARCSSNLKNSCSRCVCRAYSDLRAPIPNRKTIFSGIQPTGVPHIGNYLGALQNWVKLQDSAGKDDTLIFSIVDLHAITVPKNPEILRSNKRELLASLLAIGLSPHRSILYEQSTVREHTELSWILSTLAPLGALNRMTQFKSKSNITSGIEFADSLNSLMLGLFAYPVLQAADILLYKTNLVPVGEDQLQHLQLTRSLAKSFNAHTKKQFFQSPETLLSRSTARVRDLRDPMKKMSKSAISERSRIMLIDSPEIIRRKISSAVTDSIDGITYNADARPGIANLLEIYAAFAGQSDNIVSMARDMGALSHKAFKEQVAQAVVTSLEPIRERYLALDSTSKRGKQNLEDIGIQGTRRAQAIAQRTMKEVRSLIGLA